MFWPVEVSVAIAIALQLVKENGERAAVNG